MFECKGNMISLANKYVSVCRTRRQMWNEIIIVKKRNVDKHVYR